MIISVMIKKYHYNYGVSTKRLNSNEKLNEIVFEFIINYRKETRVFFYLINKLIQV